MKRIFEKIRKKVVDFLSWVWRECKDWRTLVLLGIVCVVVGSPVWVCYLLGFLFGWQWAFVVGSAMLAFWWLPGAPYFAVCVAVTLGLKRVFQKIKKKKERERAPQSEHASEKNAD